MRERYRVRFVYYGSDYTGSSGAIGRTAKWRAKMKEDVDLAGTNNGATH